MKSVVFDMDGVIIKSETFHRVATTEALRLYGIEREKKPEIKLRGRPLIDSMSAIVDYYKVEDDAQTFLRKRNEIFYKSLSENDIAMPGVLDLIKKLKAKKVKIALGTSATRDLADFAIKKLNLETSFSAIATFDDVLEGKPSPDIYLKAAELLNEEPSNCIAIEDADLGIQAAKSAGMTAVGFKSPESFGETLEQADYIINSFDEFDFGWL
ncbi:MAG: HAD family phosphatase [Candidatus Diapherotrites archaeon]